MTNEMKLLLAFIEASGYEVEEVRDWKKEEISESRGHAMIERFRYEDDSETQLATVRFGMGQPAYERGDNNSYFIELKDPVIDYKVTKKEILGDGTDGTYIVTESGFEKEDNHYRRKSNLLIALAAEFEAGAITDSEYLDKIRDINNENL